MDEVLYRCVIPGRARILKNGKQAKINYSTGQAYLQGNKRFAGWRIFAESFLVRAMPDKFRRIDFPVNLSVRFYLKDHQHELDTSNGYQGIEDLMQKLGIIKNDKLIYAHDGSGKIFGATRERVEITLTRMSPERYTAHD